MYLQHITCGNTSSVAKVTKARNEQFQVKNKKPLSERNVEQRDRLDVLTTTDIAQERSEIGTEKFI